MALYVKDPEVDHLATRLAGLRNTTKTEALKRALRNELEREEGDIDPRLTDVESVAVAGSPVTAAVS